MLLMPLRAVEIRYIAYSHLSSGMWRALEDGPGTDGEVLFAGQAAVVTDDFADLNALQHAAVRAGDVAAPALGFQVVSGGSFVGNLWRNS
jgi:hypothetical protein